MDQKIPDFIQFVQCFQKTSIEHLALIKNFDNLACSQSPRLDPTDTFNLVGLQLRFVICLQSIDHLMKKDVQADAGDGYSFECPVFLEILAHEIQVV